MLVRVGNRVLNLAAAAEIYRRDNGNITILWSNFAGEEQLNFSDIEGDEAEALWKWIEQNIESAL